MPLNQNFLPGSLTGKLSLTGNNQPPPPRPQAGRSRMLASLLAQKTGPDATDYTNAATQAAVGGVQGYKDFKSPPEGITLSPDEQDAKRNAGYASMGGGLASAAGSLIPGWGGRIAQLAGIVGSKYGEQQSSDVRGQMLAKMLAEPDPEKRARMAVLLGGR